MIFLGGCTNNFPLLHNDIKKLKTKPIKSHSQIFIDLRIQNLSLALADNL